MSDENTKKPRNSQLRPTEALAAINRILNRCTPEDRKRVTAALASLEG